MLVTNVFNLSTGNCSDTAGKSQPGASARSRVSPRLGSPRLRRGVSLGETDLRAEASAWVNADGTRSVPATLDSARRKWAASSLPALVPVA